MSGQPVPDTERDGREGIFFLFVRNRHTSTFLHMKTHVISSPPKARGKRWEGKSRFTEKADNEQGLLAPDDSWNQEMLKLITFRKTSSDS